ncbi:hypothetical protein CesoFtcFv8_019415 [Champsocephalus esox]|uniref:Core-binding (CB) domain-containing protein n=1 Tax=Champsocephalus esox TaxID=159716 RepID=A0AAN8BDN8_9TELE|nr:hypothetical protein CesoFtcFv8_019415 [Champsocephalus esox]
MSRGGPRQGDWSLHPELIAQVWSRFGRAEVDLFAARGNAQCVLWFSLSARRSPSGGGRVRTSAMAQGTAVRLPISPADSSVPGLSTGGAAVSDPNCPGTHGSFLVSIPTAYAVRQAMGDSVAGGRSLTGGGSNLHSPSDRPALMGMPPERKHLERWGLSQDVVRTIQGARVASTRASYTAKWAAFQRWCVERSLDHITCPLPHVLSFLQLLLDRNLTFSTIKVNAAAISSCHVGFGAGTLFSHPLRHYS